MSDAINRYQMSNAMIRNLEQLNNQTKPQNGSKPKTAEGASFQDLLNQQIRTLPGVTSTETFVYLKLNKQHYNWGTR